MSLIVASSNLFADLDGRILVSIASLAAYFVYHRYEPAGVLPALGFLVAVPGLLSASLRGISSTILGTIVVIFPLYWSLLVLVTVAYRISPFHPLARYPGPLLCKISKGWIAYLVARYGKAHIYVQELHEKYGEVVRIGPNELSISHKDMSTAVLGAKGLPRGPYYDTREHEAGVSLDGLRDPALHTIRRKPWARGMNSTAMKYYEDLVRSQVGELARAFHQREGEKVDISAWMTFFG
ncbi:hypothetical protein PHLCEN_2v10265 [Hermanssonia centrifuga]|uniref:Cytochrome P450 n=1 Tax=Hermanssonia centrifuga TaxID=98765 RepID=A0A2R6NNC3_9APHY|nr:hypothetical protein PHLCEN_2v10265 [Hermanssonia centrifuga]